TQPQSRQNALVELSRAGGSSTTSVTLSGARQTLGYIDPSFGGASYT
ncbi:MAG: hypothetical protein JOZ24_04280, partial [Candidatus Eremiobacteraeota bacterium]|nr:hypothetical protein [Candidatus Eremiobacteraeota bacterium]